MNKLTAEQEQEIAVAQLGAMTVSREVLEHMFIEMYRSNLVLLNDLDSLGETTYRQAELLDLIVKEFVEEGL